MRRLLLCAGFIVGSVQAAAAEPSAAVTSVPEVSASGSTQGLPKPRRDDASSRGSAADRHNQEPNAPQPNAVQSGTAQLNEPNPDAIQPDTARSKPVQSNTAQPSALQWEPHWARAGTTDMVVIGASFAITAGAYVLGPGHGAQFSGAIPFDEGVRDALRARSEPGRAFARDVSDVAVTLSVAQPLVFDAIVNAGWARDSPDVARQLLLMDLSVLALTTTVTTVTKVFIGRPRPYVRECGSDLDGDTYDCRDRESELSFFSGHASTTFAMASVTCVQNQYLPLWDSRWAPCAVGFGLAAGTSTLRVVADQHYATDVITGAVVGTSVGLLVPLLHFEAGAEDGAFLSEHRLMLVPSSGGAHLLGVF